MLSVFYMINEVHYETVEILSKTYSQQGKQYNLQK